MPGYGKNWTPRPEYMRLMQAVVDHGRTIDIELPSKSAAIRERFNFHSWRKAAVVPEISAKLNCIHCKVEGTHIIFTSKLKDEVGLKLREALGISEVELLPQPGEYAVAPEQAVESISEPEAPEPLKSTATLRGKSSLLDDLGFAPAVGGDKGGTQEVK